MPNFDYITAKEFRESLERDYAEMRNCANNSAWKSVQVVAGSIVEALLIDYLAATPNPSRAQKDALKLDLAEAITICRTEKAISDRTADLCSVVRSYRNLIHPGRLVRLNEQAPDKASASIALALVDMITEDLSKVLRAKVGLTGEQILSKIQRDENVMTILKHLLSEVSERQQEQLLLELIPAAHKDILANELQESDHESAQRLEAAYRMILDSTTDDIKNRVASEFVRVLREEDGERVLSYGSAFFRAYDLDSVPTQHQAMVRDHLLSRVTGTHTLGTLNQLQGVGYFLTPQDALKWVDPLIRTLISSTVTEVVKRKTQAYFSEAITETDSAIDKSILKRLDEWIPFLDEKGEKEFANVVRKLKKEVEGLQAPTTTARPAT